MSDDIDISDDDLRALLPTFAHRQHALDLLWQKAAEKSGTAVLCRPLRPGDLSAKIDLANFVELPPFLRIGRLAVEEGYRTSDLSEVHDYLERNDVPALLHFRDKSAILIFSEADPRRILEAAQRQLIQLFCNLDPMVVRCVGIDRGSLGEIFSYLREAVPDFQSITDRRTQEDFFTGIIEEFKKRSKNKGLAYEYLYQYNKSHKDALVPYLFCFVSCFETDLSDEEKELVDRLLADNLGAKAGIYLMINFRDENEFARLANKHRGIPQLIELGETPNTTKLEVRDAGGLDTTDRGVHKVLKIIRDNDDRILTAELTAYCLSHLKTQKLDPVSLRLPTDQDGVDEVWRQSSAKGVRVPIGKSFGAAVDFVLGGESGMVHHALIGGASGSGKTRLLHAILLQVMASYSPEEIRLSILDYKFGTEFKRYKSVPHLHALSLGSGTRFGVDLLSHFSAEVHRRSEIFKEHGVTDISSYRQRTGAKMPRHLVVIDEFQVLFNDENRSAKSVFEDLIRRGRASGLNFVLASQSITDESLTTPTKANIGSRICLKLSERDCWHFLSPENILPSTFKRHGQAVYNDLEGHPAANVEFQVAYYTDDMMSHFIQRLSIMASQSAISVPPPYVYEDELTPPKSVLAIHRPPDSLFYGFEEGLPRVMRFFSLSPVDGPMLVIGTGSMRAAFEENLADELRTLDARDYDDVPVDETETYLAGIDSGETSAQRVVVLRLRGKESDSTRETIQRLLEQRTTKLILFIDRLTALLYIGEGDAEPVVYLDQKTAYTYGVDLTAHTDTVVARVGDESRLILVKLPRVG